MKHSKPKCENCGRRSNMVSLGSDVGADVDLCPQCALKLAEEMTARAAITHEVKAWPEFFASVCFGERTADLRRNDRDYRRGDKLLLQEYDPAKKRYGGKQCQAAITGVIKPEDGGPAAEGLRPGWCILSLRIDPCATGWNNNIVGKRSK